MMRRRPFRDRDVVEVRGTAYTMAHKAQLPAFQSPRPSGYSGAPYSVRYSEAGFETPAVVGNLSQSNATTGRVFGDTKS